jgi:hypothetical protein
MTITHSNSRERRILVIANETVESPVLREAVSASVGGPKRADVVIVAPALNSRVRHWLSDSDGARRRAEERLQRCIHGLAGDGVRARGWTGDADPFQAIVDALRLFKADRIIIVTHPEGQSNWLARNLVERARQRFPLSILHVVVGRAERDDWTEAA